MDSAMESQESLNKLLESQRKKSGMDPEFVRFEKKVEEIGQLIKDMNCADKTVSANAMRQAKKWLGTDKEDSNDTESGDSNDTESGNSNANDRGNSNAKDRGIEKVNADESDDNLEMKVRVKTNRSVVNQKAFDRFYDKKEEDMKSTMSPEEFMKQVETDAKKRSEERKENQKIADEYSTMAEKALNNQEYEEALVKYDKAIKAVPDHFALYTTRALILLRLGLYDQVLPDCERALRLQENNMHAQMYKAHALHCLGYESEAKEIIEQLKIKFPKQVEIIERYAAFNEVEFS